MLKHTRHIYGTDSERISAKYYGSKFLFSSHTKCLFEKEVNKFLPFFDVQVEKVGSKLITFVYRKPTFAGQYHI